MQTTTDQTPPRTARRFRDDGGFTLIELLVVIVIIGVLSTVVIFSVTGINDRGQVAACKADKTTLKVAEEAAYAQDGAYVTEAVLVSTGLLEDASSLYDITLASGNYTVAPSTGSKCTS